MYKLQYKLKEFITWGSVILSPSNSIMYLINFGKVLHCTRDTNFHIFSIAFVGSMMQFVLHFGLLDYSGPIHDRTQNEWSECRTRIPTTRTSAVAVDRNNFIGIITNCRTRISTVGITFMVNLP